MVSMGWSQKESGLGMMGIDDMDRPKASRMVKRLDPMFEAWLNR